MILTPLSKSTYGTFEKCAWKAHAHKNLKLESKPGPAAIIGSETHSLIEAILKGEMTFSDVSEVASSPEIVSWIQRALAYPWPENSELFIERHGMIGSDGQLVDSEDKAILHGYMDVFWRQYEDTARFRDWKTGTWAVWNEFESHLYALGTKCHFPGVTKVIAELCYLRTGQVIRTCYEWKDNDTYCIIIKDDGSKDILWGEQNPILEYFLVRIKQIESTEPIPTPGKHCMNWYGTPCQFLGKECPLTDSQMVTTISKELEDPRRFTKAIKDVLSGKPLNHQKASDAYYAIQQMQGLMLSAEKTVQEWSKENGPILVGDSMYGWKKGIRYQVDVPYVLEKLLDANIPIEDLAKALNVSKTSISRLGKEYKDIKNTLLREAVNVVDGDDKFCEVK
jgi:hypothetical protein